MYKTFFDKEGGYWVAYIKESKFPYISGYSIWDIAKDYNIKLPETIDYQELNKLLKGFWIDNFGCIYGNGQPVNFNIAKLLNHLKSNKQHIKNALLSYLTGKT